MAKSSKKIRKKKSEKNKSQLNPSGPDVTEEGDPVCTRCGNAMIKEEEEWLCPHCQGEINFFGGDEKLD